MMTPSPSTNKQNVWLWFVLIITVALTMWTSMQPESEDTADDLVSPKTRTQQNVTLQPSKIKTNSSVIKAMQSKSLQSTWQVSNREALSEKPGNLFPVHSWAVVAPVDKTKPTPQPPPVAPPTPFTYMGKMEDGPKGTLIFLMANNKVYSVKTGENVDPFWRLDGEDTHQLMFTFLPLNLPQTLSKTQPLTSPELPNSAAGAVN